MSRIRSPETAQSASLPGLIWFCIRMAPRATVVVGIFAFAAAAASAVVMIQIALLISAAIQGTDIGSMLTAAAIAGAAFTAQQLFSAAAGWLRAHLANVMVVRAAEVLVRSVMFPRDAAWLADVRAVTGAASFEQLVVLAFGFLHAKCLAMAALIVVALTTPIAAVIGLMGVLGAAWLSLSAHVQRVPVPTPSVIEARRVLLNTTTQAEIRFLDLKLWLRSKRQQASHPQRTAVAWWALAVSVTTVVSACSAVGLPLLLPSTAGSSIFAYALTVQGVIALVANGAVNAGDVAGRSLLRSISLHLPWTHSAARPRPTTHGQVGVFLHRVSVATEGTGTILDSVDLQVRQGELLVIVGPNGAGKTTLAKVIAGLQVPDSGSVRLQSPSGSGVEIAFLGQEYPRYPLSLRANIQTDGPPDPAALARAAESAGLAELIRSLPLGIDTLMVEDSTGGSGLSGGQWQRVAIARAVFRATAGEAQVVVMDEPLSHADTEYERSFAKLATELARTRAVVIVTHRLSLCKIADRIVVVDRGRVVGSGSHADLQHLIEVAAAP